jgi:hypothetical protein
MSSAKTGDSKHAADPKAGGDKSHKKDKKKDKGAGSDDEAVDPVLASQLAASELACSGCADPCTLHPSYPDSIVRKIAKGAFTGSVKAYSSTALHTHLLPPPTSSSLFLLFFFFFSFVCL